MKNGLKIVTIGGGSSYTPELIEGFIQRKDTFPIREYWLVDVEEGKEKLHIIKQMTERMFQKAHLDIEVHETLQREEALQNADFVTTQFRVGFLDAREKDEIIPMKYGILGQETNGPGGLFKGLRTIPVILSIIEDVKRLCPNAWIINFTNPAGMITEAVHRYAYFPRFIGLCNVPVGMQNGIADMLKISHDHVRLDFFGLNHMVFGKRVYIDGIDKTADVKQRLLAAEHDQTNMKNVEEFPYVPAFLKGLDIIPCSYHRYYFKKDIMVEACRKAILEHKSRAQVVKGIEHELFELYKDPALDMKPKQLEARGGAYYSEVACNVMNAIHNDTCNIQTVNTLNQGAICNLPNDVIVEVSCVITKEGPRPLPMGALPDALIGLVTSIKSFEICAAKAAISGKYEDALVAMTINPLVQSDETGKLILDEMLEAHKTYLPQFFRD